MFLPAAAFLFLNTMYLMLRVSPASGSFPRPLSAAHVIKKYYASREDQDDLISIGTFGLIKAISSFNPEKGARLATYASRCIENAILSQRNKRRLRRRNGCLLRQNGACWREWESAAIF